MELRSSGLPPCAHSSSPSAYSSAHSSRGHSPFLRDASPPSDPFHGKTSSPGSDVSLHKTPSHGDTFHHGNSSSLVSTRNSLEDKHMKNVLPTDCDIIADARREFFC